MNGHVREEAEGPFVGRPLRDPGRIRDRGAREAENLLAGLTVEQLHAGLEKGRSSLSLLDGLDAIDRQGMSDDIGHPGRHASTSYEAWVEKDSENRRLQLQVAIREVQAELTRRGETF